MSKSPLLVKLENTKAYRATRLETAHWVISHKEMLPELLEICLLHKEEVSYRAAWVLEFVCLKDIELLIPHFNQFFKILPQIKRDQAVRPFSKIGMLIANEYYKKNHPKIKKVLSEEHKTVLVECCFDWLISNQKVAAEAYAMHTLLLIGAEVDWIHPELQLIIEQNIHDKSAAYKARGKMTLKEIVKFQQKKKANTN